MSGYQIVDTGDTDDAYGPPARWEVIGPDGRTISVEATKSDAKKVITADKRTRKAQGIHWSERNIFS